MKQYTFENLEVWHDSRELIKKVYQLTQGFPLEEKYGLTSQIRRAVVSITCNLAEGSSRQSLKDQARFSTLAYGSLMEVLNQLIIAVDLKYLDEDSLKNIRPEIEKISNKLNKLTKSQKDRYQNNQTNKQITESTNKRLWLIWQLTAAA